MVHFVPDEGIDSGPVITSQAVPIGPDDTLDTLAARIHAVEHQLLIEAIAQVLASPSQYPPTYSGGHQP
jgi:phosphoribosylglycinamide formyltransferase-1